MPRLSSAVYFSLLTDSAANERHHVAEYPTFPTTLQSPRDKRLHDNAERRSGEMDNSSLHRPRSQKPMTQLCLPLLSVSINMQVDCNIAKTKVVQTFTNHGGISIPEACYAFPLYDGATVTAFRCEVGDDKVLEGKVKPKDEAKRDFKRAVQKLEAAALGEEMAPDVFQTTIGNIEPRTTVKIEITYIEELLADLNGDGDVVTIPTSIAPRYGTPPAGYVTNSSIKETGLSLVVSVASPDSMKSIICRSGHEISVEFGKIHHVSEAASFEALAELQSQADSGLNPRHATARLSLNQTAMDRDIVLIIPYPNEVLSHSRALLAPASGLDHAAMMVTVRPNELFSDLRESMDEFEGEILFLVDRSGSMDGMKIQEIKDALLVFLKSLPENCKFNIYSFGGYSSSLWSQSMPYNESTLQEALNHVSTFEANFGGTEVLEALRKAVGDRQSTAVPSTQIILMTDGEIWQPEQTIEFVRMTTSNSDGQVRVFSLGIGNQVSHQLIKGIGFFGGGFGEAVDIDQQGKWGEAVIRMLKGAMMPTSWSYSITLGNEWKEKRLDMDDLFSDATDRKAFNDLNRTIGAAPSFVQAPRSIPRLHHFGQQSVYFLLDTTSASLPNHVLITSCSQNGTTKTVTLPVTKSATNNAAIQHLAAKAAVRDLENQDTSEARPSNKILENAERLCQVYSISSKWASFVAVSHLQQPAEHEDVEISLYKAPLTELDLLTRPGVSQASANLDIRSALSMTQDPLLRASSPDQDDPESVLSRSSSGSLRSPSAMSGGVFRKIGSRISGDSRSSGEDRRSNSIPPKAGDLAELYTAIKSTDKSEQVYVDVYRPTIIENWFPIIPFEDQYAISWQEIVRGQHADGLFHLEKRLRHDMVQHFCHGTRQVLERWLVECVKRPLTDVGEESEAMRLLVDTVMALAYIRSHFYSHRALWDLLVQKAERRLASLLNPGKFTGPDGLSAMADSAVAHAHYGRCSQPGDEGSGGKCSSGSDRCDICDSQSNERMSSAKPNDGFIRCSVSGCDVNVDDWGVFWAHAVEKGHIDSSCETARNRWSQSEAQKREPRVRKLGGIVNLIKSMKFKMLHNAKQGKKV